MNFSIFQSDNPKEPTVEDEFMMDLFIEVGAWSNMSDMLDSIDSLEYTFLFEKYKRACFGPSMFNHMLAQIAFCTANALGGSNAPFSEFVMKFSEDNSAQLIIESTCRRYHTNMKIWLKSKPTEEALKGQKYTDEQIERINKGFTDSAKDRQDLEKLAKVASAPYIRNYKNSQEAALDASN